MGFVWQFLTYGILHDGPLHLIFNMLGIHFIGRSLELIVGSTRYLSLLLISLIVGGLMWVVFNPQSASLIGFSASVLGVMSLYCLNRPNEKINLLLFFILPVSIKPKYILYGILAIEAYGFIFMELKTGSSIAHSAHLGGIITGYSFYIFQPENRTLGFLLSKIPKFTFNGPKSKTVRNPIKFGTKAKGNYTVNLNSDNSLQEEIDKILDKINSDGFGALNQGERNLLEKAKNFLKK